MSRPCSGQLPSRTRRRRRSRRSSVPKQGRIDEPSASRSSYANSNDFRQVASGLTTQLVIAPHVPPSASGLSETAPKSPILGRACAARGKAGPTNAVACELLVFFWTTWCSHMGSPTDRTKDLPYNRVSAVRLAPRSLTTAQLQPVLAQGDRRRAAALRSTERARPSRVIGSTPSRTERTTTGTRSCRASGPDRSTAIAYPVRPSRHAGCDSIRRRCCWIRTAATSSFHGYTRDARSRRATTPRRR